MQTFDSLGLNDKVLKSLGELGFEVATPIQAQAIPHLLTSDQDLIGYAQTGTGKTAAFSLPIIEKIDLSSQHPQALILCPTRELCLQTTTAIKGFVKYMRGLSVVAIYGGESMDRQLKALKHGGHIVVGTPGRVRDMIRRKKLKLDRLQYLVLDEADEMLSMGFKDELDAIIGATPEERQTLLFSATMPKGIQRITKEYMKTPKELNAGRRNMGADKVQHVYFVVRHNDKYEALKRIADSHPNIYAIVFCRTRRETKEIAERLIQDKYLAAPLHGDLSQSQREQVMKHFRKKQLQLLIATDVAARGIDVNNLTHIINYQLPDQLESYIHRSGRTGRAGNSGISMAIITPREGGKIRIIERKIGKKFEYQQVPSGQEICQKRVFNFIDKVERVTVEEAQIAPFIEDIYKKTSWMSREDLINRFVAVEFNRFLAYYKNANDLNLSLDHKDDRKRDKKQSRKERKKGKGKHQRITFTRFHMNVGKKQNLTPIRLLNLINDWTRIKNIEIGKIEILNNFSFFEIDQHYADDVSRAFNGRPLGGVTIALEVANAAQKPTFSFADKKKKKKKKRKKF